MDHLREMVLEAYDRFVGLLLGDLAVDGCITKAPCGGEKAGRSPVDRSKQGVKRSMVVDGCDIPVGIVTAPANRHDSPLLDETLDHALRTLGELPDRASVHLDRAYDSLTTRRKLEARSLIGEISQKGRPVPLSATKRWIPVKRIVASGLAEGVFDLVVPIITFNLDNPEASIQAGKYSGKVISVNSELEWHLGRALEDRGTSPNQYRYFIVPGAPHISDPLCDGTVGNRTTPAGWQPALRAHFLQGHEWVTKGVAPPTSTRLATTGGGAEIARDSNGNALLVDTTGAPAPRLPFVELGEATFLVPIPGATTPPRVLMGTYAPQPPPNTQQLGFLRVNEYLDAFGKALNAQMDAGYMLKEDADVLLNRANLFPQVTPPATFTLNYHARYELFRSCM